MMHAIREKPSVLVLLHGLGEPLESLAPLAQGIEARGFTVANATLAEPDRQAPLTGGNAFSPPARDVPLDTARTHSLRLYGAGCPPIIRSRSNRALLAHMLASENFAPAHCLMAPGPVIRTLLPDGGPVLAEGSWFVPKPPLDLAVLAAAGGRDRIVPSRTLRKAAGRFGAAFHPFADGSHWFPAEYHLSNQLPCRVARLDDCALSGARKERVT